MADDWLRSVDKNLVKVGCSDAESLRFSTHLLEGLATSWSENYQVTHPIEQVSWLSFQEVFHTAHVSAGAMSLKKREFRNLGQGGRSITGYVEKFNYLARYEPDDVKTNATQMERFIEGLNNEIALSLQLHMHQTIKH